MAISLSKGLELNTYLDSFIKLMLCNENFKASQDTRNIIKYDDYFAILKPANDLLTQHPDIEIEKYCDLLLKNSKLIKYVKELILTDYLASGMIVSYGTAYYSQTIIIGNQQETCFRTRKIVSKPEKMVSNSIFDLSSITKIFLSTLIIILDDQMIISLDDKIYDLDSRFINLKMVTIRDLLAFQVSLKTEKRIEDCLDVTEAEKLLFTVKVEINDDKSHFYSDIGAMVLKYMIEYVCEMDLYNVCKKYIFDKCKMLDTVVDVNEKDLSRTVSNNFERRIINGHYVEINNIFKGVVNDGKARFLNKKWKQMWGHSGLFSTSKDIISFCQNFILGNLLSIDKCNEIGVNRTGIKTLNVYKQYLGYLCYSKHPNSRDSEVNHCLSGNAIGLGGYTGNQLTIDVRNQLFVFLASNRCHNRVTSIFPSYDKQKYIVDLSDKKYVKWLDGKNYIYTQNFVYERDKIINEAVKLSIQCRYYEYIFGEKRINAKIIKI